MRRTGLPASRKSSNFRARPPSNSITATASAMIGRRREPNSCVGSSRGSPASAAQSGPTARPASDISTIAGACMRQASHCAPRPSAPIRATEKIRVSCMKSDPYGHVWLKPCRLLHWRQNRNRSRGCHTRLPDSVQCRQKTNHARDHGYVRKRAADHYRQAAA